MQLLGANRMSYMAKTVYTKLPLRHEEIKLIKYTKLFLFRLQLGEEQPSSVHPTPETHMTSSLLQARPLPL